MRKVRVWLIGIVGGLVLVATGVGLAQELSLSYLTYLDGFPQNTMAVDSDGNAYVPGGGLTKLAPNGGGPSDLIWAVPIDGIVTAIAVDNSGVYLTGVAGFPNGNFPRLDGTTGPAIFLTKLNLDGSEVATVHLGPTDDNFRHGGIALDNADPPNVYVTGATLDPEFGTDFPDDGTYLDFGVPKSPHHGDKDAIVAKLGGHSGNYTSPAAPTITVTITAHGFSEGDNIIIHNTDDDTNLAGTFVISAVTSDTFQYTANGTPDLLVGDLDVLRPDWLTFLGGSDEDAGKGIAVDSDPVDGGVWVTGRTRSTDFPVTVTDPDAHPMTVLSGTQDGFVAKLPSDGGQPGPSRILYATYLGGDEGTSGGFENVESVAVDTAGRAYVTGFIASAGLATTFAFDNTLNNNDAFVAVIDPGSPAASTSLLYFTYLGGSASGAFLEHGNSIAVDGDGKAYVTGPTGSSDFPVTSDAFDDTFKVSEAFVVKLDPSLTGNGSGVPDPVLNPALLYSTFLGGKKAERNSALALGPFNDIYVTGRTGSRDLPTTSGAFSESFIGGSHDGYVAKFEPGLPAETNCTDGIDNDGDGFVDCADADCSDSDEDGFKAPACAGVDPVDCDDTDPLVNPGATEICDDDKDNNCDTVVDCDDSVACPDTEPPCNGGGCVPNGQPCPNPPTGSGCCSGICGSNGKCRGGGAGGGLIEEVYFVRGDSNADRTVDISDAVFTLNHLFAAGLPPTCQDAADTNDDGKVDVSDPVYALSFLFLGGRAPVEPFGECGSDLTEDKLACESHKACQ